MKKVIGIILVLMMLSTVAAFATAETKSGLEATVPGATVTEDLDARESDPAQGPAAFEHTLTDGAVHVSLTADADGVNWFQFALANDAIFANGNDGFAFYFKNTGENDLAIYFRYDFFLNGDQTQINAFLNVDDNTFLLYPADGSDPIEDCVDGSSWNGKVVIPAGFEGYVQTLFDNGFIKEGGGAFEYESMDGLSKLVFWFTDAKAGDGFIVDDFACIGKGGSQTEPDDQGLIIKYGTPTIDGTLDEAYLGSASVEVGPAFYSQGGAEQTDSTISGTAYFLHDDDHLYLCTVVTGDTAIIPAVAADDWVNDAAEHWLNRNGKNYTFSADVDGNVFKNMGNLNHEVVTTKTEDGWIVEIALELEADYENAVFYSLQINNRLNADGAIVAHGSQAADLEFMMEPGQPEPTPTPEPQQGGNDNPPSGAISLIGFAVAAVVAGAVIVRKKHD